MLKKIFNHDAIVVIIKGFWKTGKTNVGLLFMETLIAMGIIDVFATNIKITETDTAKYICDMPTLKEFHYDDPDNPKHKGFIFDEAGKLAVKRGAMRRENVDWMRFIPELSKGRMKLIVITQAEFLTDSIFTETEFTRAFITTYKHERYGYSISIESELLDDPYIYVNKVPQCITKYSPYSSAEWFLEKQETTKTKEYICCKIARMYSIDNMSTVKIADELGYKSRVPIIRQLKKHIRHTFRAFTLEDVLEIAKEQNLSLVQEKPTGENSSIDNQPKPSENITKPQS
jgi:hypothetical protein